MLQNAIRAAVLAVPLLIPSQGTAFAHENDLVFLQFEFGEYRYPEGYDYNVPLALPPYGYTPGFWGYGGRRYYDRLGTIRNMGKSRASLTRARSSRGRYAEFGSK